MKFSCKMIVLAVTSALVGGTFAKTALYTEYISTNTVDSWKNRVYTAAQGDAIAYTRMNADTTSYNYAIQLTVNGTKRTYYAFYDRPLKTSNAPDVFNRRTTGDSVVDWGSGEVTLERPDPRYLYGTATQGAKGGATDPTNLTTSDRLDQWAIRKGYDSSSHGVTTLFQTHRTDWRFSLTFDGNGADGGSMDEQTFKNKFVVPECAFTRTGYSFTGWRDTGNSGASRVVGKTINLGEDDNDPVLQAQWKACEYTVTFDPDGGQYTGDDTRNVTFGQKYGTMTSPTWEGGKKSFKGWYLGEQKVSSGTIVNTASDHTLVAHWTSNECIVTFDGNGADQPFQPTETVVVYKQSYGTLPTPVRTGYDFVGWYTSREGGTAVYSTTDVPTREAHVLYARWKGKSIGVVFDGNGSTDGYTAAQTFVYGQPAALTSNGYMRVLSVTCDYRGSGESDRVLAATNVFAVWNSAANGSGAWSYADGSTVTNPCGATSGTVTLYAQWMETAVTVPDPQPWTGRVFKGWYADAACESEPVVLTEGRYVPKTTYDRLYAKWTAVRYTIRFASGATEATGDMDDIVCTYGVTTNLPPCGYTRAGWNFSGWRQDTEPPRSFEPGAAVSNLTETDGDTVVLTACWTQLPCTLSLRVTDDETLPSIVKFRGETWGPLPVPTNEIAGQVFAGWWTSSGQLLGTETVECDLEARARWKAVDPERAVIEVTFHANGGRFAEGGTQTNVPYASGRVFGSLPAAPIADTPGYVFFGWSTAEDPTEGVWVTVDTFFVNDRTMDNLYAQWTYKPYNALFGCDDILFKTNGSPAWIEETDPAFRLGSGRTVRSGMIPYTERDDGKVTMIESFSSGFDFVLPSPGTLSFTRCLIAGDGASDVTYSWYVNDVERDDKNLSKAGLLGPENVELSSSKKQGGAVRFEKEQPPNSKRVLALSALVSNRVDIGDFTWTPANGLETWTATNAVGARLPVSTDGGWSVTAADTSEITAESLGNDRTIWVKTSVSGKGVLTFEWQVSCEPGYVDTNGVYVCCDRLELWDGTNRVAFIDGTNGTGYVSYTYAVTESGTHDLYWRYVKDGSGSAGNDDARVRSVIWTSSASEPRIAEVIVTAFDPSGVLDCAFVVDDAAAGVTLPVTWRLLYTDVCARDAAWCTNVTDTCDLALTGARTNAAPETLRTRLGNAVRDTPPPSSGGARFFRLSVE